MTGIDYFSVMMMASEIGEINMFQYTTKTGFLSWLMSIRLSIRRFLKIYVFSKG